MFKGAGREEQQNTDLVTVFIHIFAIIRLLSGLTLLKLPGHLLHGHLHLLHEPVVVAVYL